ncbi:MAG TPA: amino acid transporter, partial [Roseovarius sp.]|nr:amino acid transporter [Roseovarius sp.]
GEVLRAGPGAGSRARAVLTCLALTWLNPHVYLDTVVLLGSVSAQYENRLGFGAGAVGASFVFFFCLGFGARLLAPFFRRPMSWRVLDALVGAVMWAIAAGLLLG